MDPRVRDVLQVLESSWWTPPRVAELARRVGLGPSQLEHLFLREVQTTIRAFITQQRMCAAARLLTASHERISTIAFEVGFNHVAIFQSRLQKAFRAVTARVPTHGVCRRDPRGVCKEPINCRTDQLFAGCDHDEVCDHQHTLRRAWQHLRIADLVGAPISVWIETLLAMGDGDDGRWPPAPVLLVPHQRDRRLRGCGHADPNGLLTTAAVVLALKNGSHQPV